MSQDPQTPLSLTPLSLRPEHLSALAAAALQGVVGAKVWSGGRLNQDGFNLFGRLEFLSICGLVEPFQRCGDTLSGDREVWIYYAITRQGRIVLRWRLGDWPEDPPATPIRDRRSLGRDSPDGLEDRRGCLDLRH